MSYKQLKRSKSPKNKKISLLVLHLEQPKSPKLIREKKFNNHFFRKSNNFWLNLRLMRKEEEQWVNSPTTEAMKKSQGINVNFIMKEKKLCS
jgi:hypothetical protein